MTGRDVRALRHALSMTQEEFARTLGVDRRSIGRWEGNWTHPQPLAARALAVLDVARDRIAAMAGPSAYQRRPNRHRSHTLVREERAAAGQQRVDPR